MSHNKILELAKKFAHKINETNNINEKFQIFRVNIEKLHDYLALNLRMLIGELEQDIFLLRERKLDISLLKLIIQVRNDITKLMKDLNKISSYEVGNKLVSYVYERNSKSVIDNLDFLIQHHLNSNKINSQTGLRLKHPQALSLNKLRLIGAHVKAFIEKNPTVDPPGRTPSIPPPWQAGKPSQLIPELGKDDKTYAGNIKKEIPSEKEMAGE